MIDIDNNKEINSHEYNASYIAGMLTKENNLYMLFNRSIGTDFNMLVASYNYIDNEENWSRTFDGNFGIFITKSYPDGTNDIAVVNYQTVNEYLFLFK